jgi:arylsulfatase A-like enzyme
MRVPGIFYMPGKIKAGVTNELGSTLDLMPTIAALTGSKLPKDRVMDGYDLSSVLFNNEPGLRDHFIYYRKREIYAVRKGAYKAHYITEDCYLKDNGRVDHQKPLLFNVNYDPGEHYDHAEDYPEILNEIKTLTEAHQSSLKFVASELDK